MNPQAAKAESVLMTSPPIVSANPSTRTGLISITIYKLQHVYIPQHAVGYLSEKCWAASTSVVVLAALQHRRQILSEIPWLFWHLSCRGRVLVQAHGQQNKGSRELPPSCAATSKRSEHPWACQKTPLSAVKQTTLTTPLFRCPKIRKAFLSYPEALARQRATLTKLDNGTSTPYWAGKASATRGKKGPAILEDILALTPPLPLFLCSGFPDRVGPTTVGSCRWSPYWGSLRWSTGSGRDDPHCP